MKILVDEQESKLNVKITKAEDLKSPLFKHVFPCYKSTPSLDDIDVEIRPIIADLWKNGYKTLTCCSGHGKDAGFIVWRPPRGRRWMAVHWGSKAKIPSSLAEIVNKEDFSFQEFSIEIRMSKSEIQKFKQLAENN